MAKKANGTEKKEINLSEINAGDTVTMLPADVKFDASGRTTVTNDRVNEYIKETLVEAGSIVLTPGGDDPASIGDINVFCHFDINLRKGCSKKE